MIYYLAHWMAQHPYFDWLRVLNYISVRTLLGMVLALFITVAIGGRVIRYLQKMQLSDEVRDLGLAGEESKKHTPSMGGLIIICAIVIPTLLLARVGNVYILLALTATLWLGLVGFIDDYIKVIKKDKKGLSAKFKIVGQVGLGMLIGSVLYFNSNVVIERKIVKTHLADTLSVLPQATSPLITRSVNGKIYKAVEVRTPITTIPFVKNHEFNYAKLLPNAWKDYTYIVYILIVIFIITAVSNGANLTDGLDGLATGVSGIVALGLWIFTYVSGNIYFANYLGVMFIPHLSELSIFIACVVGACIGFLWFNSFPAQVFMGDTGSLMLGGVIASLAIIVRKELLIPVFCGIFLIENISVMLQVAYFKYTKKKYGTGRRIFLMSPLHHHYQKKGIHENKIVIRFWLSTIVLVAMSLITLKIR